MTLRMKGLAWIAVLATFAARAAWADTIAMEAESPATISNPLLIKDAFAGSATPASAGRYLEVQAGNNNNASSTTPALDPNTGQVPGQACYSFFIFDSGNYKVWARVIAPTTGDDSFWVKMDNGAWINWNNIKPGSAWHWDFVHTSGAPTQPINFSFAEQTAHVLCVAHREDGAKLDALLVTDDFTIDPPTALTPPFLPEVRTSGGKLTIFLEWTAVPGATSFDVKRSTSNTCFTDPSSTFTTIKTVSNGFTATDTGRVPGVQNCYLVTMHGGGVLQDSAVVSDSVSSNFQLVTETDSFSLTPPLEFVDTLTRKNPSSGANETLEINGFATQSTVATQTDAANIKKGFARFDFQLPETLDIRVWGLVTFFDNKSDSFWVRLDRGAWFKWNGWTVTSGNTCTRKVNFTGRLGGGWLPLYDGDSPTAPKKVFTALPAGTHTIEFAYREPAAGMDRAFIGSDLTNMPGGCFD